jgi:sugar transferase (PEP-CTERM/EpsH1 system associated)
MAEYAMSAAGRGHVSRILDMVDIDSEKWTELAMRATWPMRAVWAREGRTLLGFERRAALAFDRTLFVSDAECRRFSTLAPESAGRTGFVENGVDLAYFDPALTFPRPFPAGARTIVFTGTMDYWPNADAMLWFAREVMPLLRARESNVLLAVVGANPTPEVLALAAAPDVTVTGRVDDVRPYVAHADVAVAPLRLARGIQNKVLEGMAMGRAVVASPQAFEGVRAEAGRDLLVADGAEATADAICAVLAGAHPGLREAARAAMERGYSWEAALHRLDDIMRLDFTGPAAAPRETMP